MLEKGEWEWVVSVKGTCPPYAWLAAAVVLKPESPTAQGRRHAGR